MADAPDEARARAHLDAHIRAAENLDMDDLDGGEFDLGDDDMNDPELLAMLGDLGWQDEGGDDANEEEGAEE